MSDVPSERDRRSSDETEEKAPGVEPFEGEGGTDTGPPHETTPEQDEDGSGTGANNQGAVQRPDQH